MAYTVTKNKLSGSTNGRQIKITTDDNPGTTIHTACSGTTNWDEVWIWVTNTYHECVQLTVHYSDYTGTNSIYHIWRTLPPLSGWVLWWPGKILQNSKGIKLFTSIPNVVMAAGYVIEHRS